MKIQQGADDFNTRAARVKNKMVPENKDAAGESRIQDKVSIQDTGEKPLFVSSQMNESLARGWERQYPPADREIPFTILHTNDIHGHAEPFSLYSYKFGGMAYLSREIDTERAEDPSHTLLLDGGDTTHGAPLSDLFEGHPMVESMNLMAYTAMVLGNHDFDDGLVALAKKIDRTNAPILAANLVNRREDSPLEGKVQPYIIREIDGVKIGIIGMVTPDALQMLHDKKELEMIDITPPEVALDKYLPEMKAKGVNTVVMLSHLGIDPDLDIARAYEGRVNIIVGGHSHTRLKKPQFVGSTVVVQAGCFGMGLGKLKLAYNPGTGNVRCVDYRLTEIRPDRLEPDPKVESLIAGYEEELGPDMNVIIGKIDRDLVQKDFHVFREESNIGDMMTDIIRETTGADIGFLTASSMRSNLFRGTLRARDIYSVFPWQNNLSTIRLKGKYIPRLLEQGLTDVANGIAVSGIKVEIDTSRPPGHRILSVTDNDGKPLKPDRYYTIATRDFLAEGNLGLDAMGKGKQKQDLGDIRSMVIEGIKKLKVLSAVMDGRLINRAK